MKSLSRGEKRLGVVCALGLLLVVGIGFYRRTLALALVRIPAPVLPPVPNGFDAYVAAARAIVPANPPVDAINDLKIRTPQQVAVFYSPKRRRAWLASNSAAWALMARAKSLPCRAPNLRATTGSTPAWKQLRDLARCQSIRVKDAKASGNWSDAINLGLDTFEMARNIERGSVYIGSLVAMAIEAISDRSLEDVPPHLDATSAKSAARRLENIISRAQPFAEVLREEKWTVLTAVQNKNSPTVTPRLIERFVMPPARVMSATAEMMDSIIAQADKPLRLQTPPTSPPKGLVTAIANNLFPVFEKATYNDARRGATERLLLLRLALRAYRLEHGSYPPQLSALCPAYLRKIPVDPYGKGEPLRYKTRGDSYLVWSIGPDGIDNRGQPILAKKGQKRPSIAPESKGDVVAHS